MQRDFLKSIDVYENGKYFHAVSEHMLLKIFSHQEHNGLVELVSKSFPQPLYDSVMIKSKSNCPLIGVSIKN